MDWAELIEILLPILLELLENSPEEQAMKHMKAPGVYVRTRIKSKLRSQLDVITEAALAKLATMTDEQKRELIAMAKNK